MAIGRQWPEPTYFCRSRIRLQPEPSSPRPISTSVFLDDSGSVSKRNGDILQAQHRFAFGLAARNSPSLSLCSARSRPSSDIMRERPARAGVPVGKARIVVDKPAKGGLNDGEGGGSLHDLAKRHASIEKFGSTEKNMDHGRYQHRSMRDNGVVRIYCCAICFH